MLNVKKIIGIVLIASSPILLYYSFKAIGTNIIKTLELAVIASIIILVSLYKFLEKKANKAVLEKIKYLSIGLLAFAGMLFISGTMLSYCPTITVDKTVAKVGDHVTVICSGYCPESECLLELWYKLPDSNYYYSWSYRWVSGNYKEEFSMGLYNEGEYKFYCELSTSTAIYYSTTVTVMATYGESCTDECSYSGQTDYYCVGNSIYKKVCGNYDSDSCLEWSSGYFVKNCNNQDGWYCRDSYTREYRDYYCSEGSCKYTVTQVERCPSGYKCVNGECKPANTVVACSNRRDISVTIESVKPSKNKYNPGDEITVTVKIKNNRNYKIKALVEVGAIPYSLAVNWGIVQGKTSLIPLSIVRETSCCYGQENIEDKWVLLEPYEETTLTFKIKIPYKGIKDLCYNNQYWTGEGDYVIYVVAFDKCWNPQTGHKACSNFDTKTIKIEKEKSPEVEEWKIQIDIIKAAAASILAVFGLALLLL